jgi:KUP system potassium uptake protein
VRSLRSGMDTKLPPAGTPQTRGPRTALLAFSALGIVFGDIGTSPLYAFGLGFTQSPALRPDRENVLGVLSLIFWALVVIISIKYLLLILRVDNQGEGGILALMELVLPGKRGPRPAILAMGLFGAALLYGDGTITPAISVLSAVEGLEVATPVFTPYVVPIALAVLLLLFLFQRRGTEKVSRLFGPVMLVWFPVIALTGLLSILRRPEVLAAVDPRHALAFFSRHRLASAFTLGAVFLVVTGGEALYADLGHFGRRPIRLAWFAVVFPSLLLNYFGQGALVLADPSAVSNPFYLLVPPWALYPMVLLATLATVIASQAIISGAYSLTFQAVHLSYLPRMRVLHTAERQKGQIYMPQVNWIMFAATALVVVGFGSSGSLAGAYGVAVSGTMALTTLLGYAAMRRLWGWRRAFSLAVAGLLLLVDLSFLGANLLKLREGGWYPILAGAVLYFLMQTWIGGRQAMVSRVEEYVQPLTRYLEGLDFRKVRRVPGTAVYLTEHPFSTPLALILNVAHNRVIHRRLLFVSVTFKDVPHVKAGERIAFQRLRRGHYRILVRYGFMDQPDLRAALRIVTRHHVKIDLAETTFFLGRRVPVPARSVGMRPWRDRLFILMARNAERIIDYFNLPPERVVEIGTRLRV